MLFRNLRRFKSNVFKSLDPYIPEARPLRPIDPILTNYLQWDSFHSVKGRQLFLSPLLCAINSKCRLIARGGAHFLTNKEYNRILAVVGLPGTGKTTAVGLIAALVQALHDGKVDEVKSYLQAAIPHDRLDEVISNLKNYIVIPISFNGNQEWDESEGDSVGVSILARIGHTISLSSGKKEKDAWKNVLRDVANEDINPTTVVKFLKEQYGQDKKFIFSIDEFMNIKDEKARENVLSFLGQMMDQVPGSVLLVTSLSMEILRNGATKSKRLLDKLHLTQVPELLMMSEKIRKALQQKPELIGSFMDLSSYPRLVMGNFAAVEVFIKNDHIARLTDPVLHGSLLKQYFSSNLMPERAEFIESFGKMLFDSRAIDSKLEIGFMQSGNARIPVTVSELVDLGILSSSSLTPEVSKYQIDATVDWNVPLAPLPVIAYALKNHPAIQDCNPVPAFWALCLATIRPWPVNTGDQFELFLALNECFRLSSDVYDGEYFACNDVGMEKPIRKLAFVYNPKTALLLKDMERLLKNKKMLLKERICSLPAKQSEGGNPNVFDQIDDVALQEFAAGGMVLMNSERGPGFDFAAMDGDQLVFYEAKYSKPSQDGHGQSLRLSDIKAKFEKCLAIYNRIKERVDLINSAKERSDGTDGVKNVTGSTNTVAMINGFRLRVYSYRAVDERLIKEVNDELPNVELVGPDQIMEQVPLSFRNRFEFVKDATGETVIARMDELASQLSYELFYGDEQMLAERMKMAIK